MIGDVLCISVIILCVARKMRLCSTAGQLYDIFSQRCITRDCFSQPRAWSAISLRSLEEEAEGGWPNEIAS